MRAPRITGLFLCVFTLPAVASAAPFDFLFEYANGLDYGWAYATERPGGRLVGLHETYSSDADGLTHIGTLTDAFSVVGGELHFTSGPFRGSRPTVPNGTFDIFGKGGTLTALWTIELPGGGTRDIEFSAWLGELQLTSFGCCGHIGGTFRHGTFAADDAAFLGLPAAGIRGDINFALDDNHLHTGPTDKVYRLYGFLVGREVPEPAPLVLALTGGAAWFASRRPTTKRLKSSLP